MIRTDKNAIRRKLLYGDDFYLAFAEYCAADDDAKGKKIKNFSNFLTERQFSIKDTTATYRMVNHWASMGLIPDVRAEDSNGWRKFSIVDLTWLKILAELRKYGFSLDKIKVAHSALFYDYPDMTAIQKAKRLEFSISLCFLGKAIYCIVYPDGFLEIATKNIIELSESLNLLDNASYLTININVCLNNIFPEKNFNPTEKSFNLTAKEIELLKALRLGDYDEINIIQRDGTINRIETKTKHIGDIGKIGDIMHQVSHGDFLIKKQDGKIVFLEETKKIKL